MIAHNIAFTRQQLTVTARAFFHIASRMVNAAKRHPAIVTTVVKVIKGAEIGVVVRDGREFFTVGVPDEGVDARAHVTHIAVTRFTETGRGHDNTAFSLTNVKYTAIRVSMIAACAGV